MFVSVNVGVAQSCAGLDFRAKHRKCSLAVEPSAGVYVLEAAAALGTI